MRRLTLAFFLFFALLTPVVGNAQTPNITTVAGGGPNNLPAVSANVDFAASVATDTAGDLFIAECGSSARRRVFKVDTSGQLTVFAGNGILGFSGDGGPATSAQLECPGSVALDSSANLFIPDIGNEVVRRVDAITGNISTVAGTPGVSGFSGDGGPATSAQLNSPIGVAVDSAGNFFIADSNNCVIRKVDTTGTITTVAGSATGAGTGSNCGFGGDGGLATSALLNFPLGVAPDSLGDLFIADTDNSVIRRVDAVTGNISTVAGNTGVCPNPTTPCGDGGPATSAQLNFPDGVTVDSSGNLFIADSSDNRIRQVAASTQVISTSAGNGTEGFSGEGVLATNASLFNPRRSAVDASGNLFIGDFDNNVIRRVDAATQNITIVAGTVDNDQVEDGTDFSGDGGPATMAIMDDPAAVIVDSSANLFISDRDNSVIRRVDATSGNINTVAGTPDVSGFSGDGGLATSAQLSDPNALALDSSGNLFIADTDNCVIRRVDATTKNISTVAGTSTGAGTGSNCGFAGDGGAATSAQLNFPVGVAVDSSGSLFIADTDNCVIRRVDATTKNISTVAGTSTGAGTGSNCSLAGDGGAATSAQLNFPDAVVFDIFGNLFIADTNNEVVRMVDAGTQTIATVAGNGTEGFSGDGGLATAAELDDPKGIALDSAGNLFIADSDNDRMRSVPGAINFAIAAAGGSSTTQTVTAGATATYMLQVSVTGGFTPTEALAVALSCSGAPAKANCTASSSSVTANPSAMGPFTVMVTTMANGMSPGAPDRVVPPGTRLPIGLPWLALLLALLAGLAATSWRRTGILANRRAWVLTAAPLAAIVFAILLSSGCRNGSVEVPQFAPPPTMNGTPPGTYTLTVTGTSGGASRTLQLTLIVQ